MNWPLVALALLFAAPAAAQPPVNEPTEEQVRQYEREQSLTASLRATDRLANLVQPVTVDTILAEQATSLATTPLPPPCGPSIPRTTIEPRPPAPAPCEPTPR